MVVVVIVAVGLQIGNMGGQNMVNIVFMGVQNNIGDRIFGSKTITGFRATCLGVVVMVCTAG